VILSKGRAFTTARAARSGKAIVLIQSGIHAGEIDGKDASLMLMRDIAVRKSEEHLLDHAIVLFVPIFNVDGHERFGAFNRINQNGPEEMGWRVTAQNLNLNRDYMKADAPEMRAMLRLMAAWLPDCLIDCHVTDGIDFQYDLTYAMETGPGIDTAVSRWITSVLLPPVLLDVEHSGHKIFSYVFPREDRDLSKGLTAEASTPRFSTGYAALQNRPALLIETHMLKPYRTRVEGTYQLLRAMLQTINRGAGGLRATVREADARVIGDGKRGGAVVPLRLGLGKKFTERTFLGIRSREEPSPVTGVERIVYTGEPFETTVPFYDQVIVEDSVVVPEAYLVPREWTAVRDVLNAHGIVIGHLTKERAVEVETYRFVNVNIAAKSYEGRAVATFGLTRVREKRTYPAGTLVVRTAQRTGRIIVNLLEPGGPDSFASWGFFNAVFEQKEYAEPYVMEGVGKRMLESDRALRSEYERTVASDTAFARSPAARLNWLYRRSAWADPNLNAYPVGRAMKLDAGL
jgi:hypothetical protein